MDRTSAVRFTVRGDMVQASHLEALKAELPHVRQSKVVWVAIEGYPRLARRVQELEERVRELDGELALLTGSAEGIDDASRVLEEHAGKLRLLADVLRVAASPQAPAKTARKGGAK